MLTKGFHEGHAYLAYTRIPAPGMKKAGAESLGSEAPAPAIRDAAVTVVADRQPRPRLPAL